MARLTDQDITSEGESNSLIIPPPEVNGGNNHVVNIVFTADSSDSSVSNLGGFQNKWANKPMKKIIRDFFAYEDDREKQQLLEFILVSTGAILIATCLTVMLINWWFR